MNQRHIDIMREATVHVVGKEPGTVGEQIGYYSLWLAVREKDLMLHEAIDELIAAGFLIQHFSLGSFVPLRTHLPTEQGNRFVHTVLGSAAVLFGEALFVGHDDDRPA